MNQLLDRHIPSQFLDHLHPTSLLTTLGGGALPAELELLRAEALLDLDCSTEAAALIEPLPDRLSGDDRAIALRLRSELLLRMGQIDRAILDAHEAVGAARSVTVRGAALAWAAAGYARKRCWVIAEQTLREAVILDPDSPLVMVALARVRLEMDQRLEARAAYERLATLNAPWAPVNACRGLAYVALLLGEFAKARSCAETALAASPELVAPLFTLCQIALSTNDVALFAQSVAQIEARSPQSEMLVYLRHELEQLRRPPNISVAQRLSAFPTTVQRRDHCGPSTIELVLRYWKGGLDLSNEQIARVVKLPRGGTPPYRMREFFHLVGFDTLRCMAPPDRLRQLVAAGFPAIVELEFANSAHVTVVIGYDAQAKIIEFQDPMTHAISPMPIAEVQPLRTLYADSALIAFPMGSNHERTLARMGLFDDPVLVWVDQAALELDQGRYAEAVTLASRAAQRLPRYGMAWVVWLNAELERWRVARRNMAPPRRGIAQRLPRYDVENHRVARDRFFAVLDQARTQHPEAKFVGQFEGRSALIDGDLARALAAFERAHQRDTLDARSLALMAECRFGLRDWHGAREAASMAIERDPSLPAANIWMSFSLVVHKDRNAIHYARCAVELTPKWWLARLALADAHAFREEWDDAHRELAIAEGLNPHRPEVLTARGAFWARVHNPQEAVATLEAALQSPLPLSPTVHYLALQMLCQLLFGSGLFHEAIKHVRTLLTHFPHDAWASQFYAATQAERFLLQEKPLSRQAISLLRKRYETAIQLNAGALWSIRDYLGYLDRLAGHTVALAAAHALLERYPGRNGLHVTIGRLLVRAEQDTAAARAMLTALGIDGGIENRDELYEAVRIILTGLGLKAGREAILNVVLPTSETMNWNYERTRALGLALAFYAVQRDEAKELLHVSLEQQPDDPLVILHLGEATTVESDREACFRRALMLEPTWSFARERLADHLIEQNRYNEALELTSGHEHELIGLLESHGQALIGVGRYEEAAETFTKVIAYYGEPRPWLFWMRWFAQDNAGMHQEAAQTAQQAIAYFTDQPTWHLQLARSLIAQDGAVQAEQVIAQGKARGLSLTDELEFRFEVAWHRNEVAAALELAVQLAAYESEPPAQHLSRWQTWQLRLLLELGRKEAAYQFVEAYDLNADGWGNASWEALHANAWAVAYDFAKRALALEHEHFRGLFALAQSLREQDREAEALEAYFRLREAHPYEHNAYEKLALSLAVDDQLDEAYQLADHAVALGAFCPFAWATRGYVAFVRGDREAALADLIIAWKRADVGQQRDNYCFWWLLASLQANHELAERYRLLAIKQAKTQLDHRQIAQIVTLYAG